MLLSPDLPIPSGDRYVQLCIPRSVYLNVDRGYHLSHGVSFKQYANDEPNIAYGRILRLARQLSTSGVGAAIVHNGIVSINETSDGTLSAIDPENIEASHEPVEVILSAAKNFSRNNSLSLGALLRRPKPKTAGIEVVRFTIG